MKTISLIVPCYNEEAIIYKTFNELSSYVEIIKDYNFQFIFVNDGSEDKTLEILKMIKAKEDRVIIININKNSGEFTGIKIALMNCNSDYAIWLQADLQVPCEVISKSIEAIETNPGHEVIYSLGHPHGSHFFSQLFWSWLFFRFTKKLGKYQLDAFLVNKRIIYNIQKKENLYNVPPFEVFKSKNFLFINFRKKIREFGGSRYHMRSKIKIFIKTVFLSFANPFMKKTRKIVNYEILK